MARLHRLPQSRDPRMMWIFAWVQRSSGSNGLLVLMGTCYNLGLGGMCIGSQFLSLIGLQPSNKKFSQVGMSLVLNLFCSSLANVSSRSCFICWQHTTFSMLCRPASWRIRQVKVVGGRVGCE